MLACLGNILVVWSTLHCDMHHLLREVCLSCSIYRHRLWSGYCIRVLGIGFLFTTKMSSVIRSNYFTGSLRFHQFCLFVGFLESFPSPRCHFYFVLLITYSSIIITYLFLPLCSYFVLFAHL